jgi:hypothetical protein
MRFFPLIKFSSCQNIYSKPHLIPLQYPLAALVTLEMTQTRIFP